MCYFSILPYCCSFFSCYFHNLHHCFENSNVIVIFCATVVTQNADISRKMSIPTNLRKQFRSWLCVYYFNGYICYGRMSDQDDLLSDIKYSYQTFCLKMSWHTMGASDILESGWTVSNGKVNH